MSAEDGKPRTGREPLTRPSTAFADRPPGNAYILPPGTVLDGGSKPARTVDQPLADKTPEEDR